MDWEVGDWVVFDLRVGQIKELREDGGASFSDGFFETSGRLTYRFRPLTLKNKNIVETFDTFYHRLREIDGNSGFNYPDISRYFSQLALEAIDADDGASFYKKAQEFIRGARDYKPIIDNVKLFRRAA
jgi:hypothetical protein